VLTDSGSDSPYSEIPLKVLTDQYHRNCAFAYRGNRVYRTSDQGSHFQRLNLNLPPESDIYAMIHSPLSEELLAVVRSYNTFGGIYSSHDHGETWKKISRFWAVTVGGIPPSLYASNFGWNQNSNFYHSTDSGRKWTSARSQLPFADTIVNKIIANHSGVYLATNHGILRNIE
jgi:photosystem II stability/assembly factor-like uncharacterized protein